MEGGNCDICFDMRDSILDVLLYHDGARLFSWSFSEHGPHKRNENSGVPDIERTQNLNDLEATIRQQLISFGDHGIRLILAT